MVFTAGITQEYTDKAVVTIKTSILLTAIRLNSGLTKPRCMVSRCTKSSTQDFKKMNCVKSDTEF